MAYRVVGVIVEKVPPKLGCGGLLGIIFLVLLIGIAVFSSSRSSHTYMPSPSEIHAPSPRSKGSPPPLDDHQPTSPPRRPTKVQAPPAAGRGALGIGIVDIDEIDASKRAKLGIVDDSGVLVTSVAPGGAADVAGLRPRDVILAVNGTAVLTTRDVQTLVGDAGIGSNATVRVRRAGITLTLRAVLQAATLTAPGDPGGSTKAENDGTDAMHPVLAPDDVGFVDTRGGWGWGNRCWLNIKAGKLGWAKAECQKGMALDPASPNPRASLLYNLGIIENKAGNSEGAREYFEQSLALREHPDVRAALDSLP